MTRMMFLVLLVICLGIKANAVTKTSNNEGSHKLESEAVLFSGMRPVREGELLLLQDRMQQGDTLLKERQQDAYVNLKEMQKEGDTSIKELFVDGVASLKEQLEEGDAQLKRQLEKGESRLQEELEEDTAWLKDKLNKGETRMKEELAEEGTRTKEELQDLKDSFESVRTAMREWTQRNTALMDHLQQQMSQVQLQVNRSDIGLQSTKDQLRSLSVTMDTLLSNSDQDVSESLNSSREKQLSLNVGSTFVRWGRDECPDNTSLVYSGVVGGSFYDHSGGAANYLCLVQDPEMDDMDLPPYYTLLYGAEYERVQGQHSREPLCSVCRTSLATTIMVPATRTCPPGWTTQYQGHLMADHNTHKRGTEYVCVDLIKESRQARDNNDNGALMYYVVAICGSLPCPPFVNKKVVTCVVCSA